MSILATAEHAVVTLATDPEVIALLPAKYRAIAAVVGVLGPALEAAAPQAAVPAGVGG